jgi:TonB-dependent receptor
MNHSGIHQSKYVWILILALVFLGQTKLASGQSRTGAIGGTVTDPSGAVLKGAQISIGSGGINVASDEQGLFYRSGLPPGTYDVTVAYVGFASFKKTVAVAAGQTTTVNAQLTLRSQSQSVIVTAPRAGGEAEAINIGRTAGNIVQVLPKQVIQSLPNANMADAVGRLPSVTLERDEGEGKYIQVRGTEPRLTNASVDGVDMPSPESDVRQMKFDAIPADSVEYVEVNKTLQANMDGDGIGGSVNLVTKTPTNTPDITLGALGGYTPIINGRGLTEENGTFGERFGASKKFGFLVSGSYDWNGRGIDDVEPAPDLATLPTGSTERWFDAQDIREYQYFRSRWGLNGDADYRVGQGSDVYFKWFYSDFKNYGDRWAYSLTDNTPNVSLLNGNGGGMGTPSFNSQLRAPDIGVGSLILGGNHVLSTAWFTWNVAAARSFDRNANPSTSSFNSTLDTSSCQYDPTATTSEYLPQWSSACYAEAYNPANMTLGDISVDKGVTGQVNLEASGSMGKLYNIGSHSATLEFGGKFRNAHKYADTYNIDYTANGTIPMTTFPNYLTSNNYYNGGEYKLGYNPREETIVNYLNANPDQFTPVSTYGQDPSFFDFIEKVSAGYVMNTIDVSSRLRFYAGLRVEHTSDGVENFSIGDTNCTNADCVTPNFFSGSYTTFLPSASLKYAFSSNDDLRFVFARGLSRPDYSNIAQALSWSTNGNGANKYSVSFGNASLKAEIGDDLDLLWDHYFTSFGMFSAGFFYKHLNDPIIDKTFRLVNYQPPGGPLGNYLADQFVNAGSAWITGFEASYIQHFTFLPGAWSGLGISANYGYDKSRASGIPDRSDNPPLLRTSPNAFNISPTYDHGRLSARVGLSYNQASIYGYQYTDCANTTDPNCSPTPGGVNGPLSDIYFYSHFQVDAQGSVALAHGLRLIVSGLNLNNEVFGFYQGSPQYMIQREYYRPSIIFGVRWSPERER